MAAAYSLFGAETSAFSTKMRSYLAYKGVSYVWRPRTAQCEAELQATARFSTLPVLVTSSGFAVHDTTPMIEALEADAPEPSATPDDPAIAFLAAVFEEYADTWLAKAVYHYRWTRKKDQRIAAQRAVEDYYGDDVPENRKAIEDTAIVRMLDELRAMGLDGDLGALVEKSFKRFLRLLDEHFRRHLYLFGGTPSVADFALAGQLIQMMKDPTPAKVIEKDAPFVAKWCAFMSDPKAGGPFATLDDLRETLLPLLSQELAQNFLPWAAENLESALAGRESFDVAFGRETLSLKPLKSAARSFRDLRRRFLSAQEIAALRALTDEAGATVYLQRPALPERGGREIVRDGSGADASSEDAEASAGEAVASERESRARRRRRRRGGRAREMGGETSQQGADEPDSGDEAGGEAAEAAETSHEEGSDDGAVVIADPPADAED
jgi:glutathione S-transferase